MKFRDSEKRRYEQLKPILFSAAAQSPGNYRGIPRSFCLADDCSRENLFTTIREPAIQYFRQRRIPWHDGLIRRTTPSNHLCCSQSCCVNFLYPFVQNRALAEEIFRQFYPDLSELLPLYDDDILPNGTHPFLAFEWIGSLDFLGESRRKGSSRTRGANATSADFAFRFRRQDGRNQLVLGEWKYTEEYARRDLGIAARKENYINAFDRGPFAEKGQGLYNALFFEPFYQLMRLQLLAQEMESGDMGREMDCDVVTVLHISPEANHEFRDRVTSPYLKDSYPNTGTMDIWKHLAPAEKFLSISVEVLLETITNARMGNPVWKNYLATRYSW